VHVRVLPQVHGREVEAEHLHGAPQVAQPATGEQRGIVGGERAVDHVEVGRELGDARIGGRLADRVAHRFEVIEFARRRGHAGIQAGERAAVGLVGALRVPVGRALGEREQLGGRLDHGRRARQVGAELVQLLQVPGEDPRRLHAQRAPEHLGRHERVAVAVAADPGAHAQERRRLGDGARALPARERVLERGIQARQLVQEGLVVVGDAVRHLVDHREPLAAQHARLPQREHVAAHRLVVGLALLGREAHAVALLEQRGDASLGVEHDAPLHLGGMRREHRHDQRLPEEPGQCVRPDPGGGDAVHRVGEAALARRGPADQVCARASDVVQVLGDVGEVREVAEGAHHDHGVVGAEPVEDGLQLGPRLGVVVAVEGDRAATDALDEVEGVRALLLAHGVAEQAAEQADVLAQRLILVFLVAQAVVLGRDGANSR
jgi:hypothetical protein